MPIYTVTIILPFAAPIATVMAHGLFGFETDVQANSAGTAWWHIQLPDTLFG